MYQIKCNFDKTYMYICPRLNLKMLNFLNVIINLPYLELLDVSVSPLSIQEYHDQKIEDYQRTVQNLVRLHGSAGWPGSIILVAKANHFWFKQEKATCLRQCRKVDANIMYNVNLTQCCNTSDNNIKSQRWKCITFITSY